ncbi:hypothetical protein ACET3Z_022180 [Daucus carota]
MFLGLDATSKLFQKMKANGLRPGYAIFAALVDSMGKAGRLVTSMKVYMKMQGFGLRPSAGKLETALKLWDEMRKFEEHSISEGLIM